MHINSKMGHNSQTPLGIYSPKTLHVRWMCQQLYWNEWNHYLHLDLQHHLQHEQSHNRRVKTQKFSYYYSFFFFLIGTQKFSYEHNVKTISSENRIENWYLQVQCYLKFFADPPILLVQIKRLHHLSLLHQGWGQLNFQLWKSKNKDHIRVTSSKHPMIF